MEASFQEQGRRLGAILRNAIDGCEYVSSRSEEGGRHLVIEARRSDGRNVGVRFRGVRSAEASRMPAPGTALRLRSAGPAGSPLRYLIPPIFRAGVEASRVRIIAGETEIEIVCEDAEWWEGD
jgi:hypothetical protein